jgi:hypothetical protein
MQMEPEHIAAIILCTVLLIAVLNACVNSRRHTQAERDAICNVLLQSKQHMAIAFAAKQAAVRDKHRTQAQAQLDTLAHFATDKQCTRYCGMNPTTLRTKT